MSKHGGARPGASRRPGSKNQRSAEIAQQAANEEITPIEVMLTAMRDFWVEGTPEAKRERQSKRRKSEHLCSGSMQTPCQRR
jgi:hypothetical protein